MTGFFIEDFYGNIETNETREKGGLIFITSAEAEDKVVA